MLTRSLRHRAPLLWLVLPAIVGLALAKAWDFTSAWLLLGIAAASAGTACWAAWRQPRAWAPAIVATMLCAGAASYVLQRARLPAWDALPAREAHLTLRIDRVFTPADARRATGLGIIVATDEHLRELVGQRLYFSLALRKDEAPPIRSATISALGVLTVLPRNPPSDTFDGFLAGAGINFRLARGQVLAEERAPLAYYRFCAAAARRCHEILGLGIAAKRPALTGLLRAMMLGDTHELSNEQHTLFMQSGTMHLFAISGLNIAVMAGALQVLLSWIRVPAWLRFVLGGALLWLFVDITGAAPSAVRAFGMTIFVQAAFLFQRPANVLASLTASAFCVVVFAPLQVFSASFIMSYAIVLALLLLGLPLSDGWLERWMLWSALPRPTWTWAQRLLDRAWRTLLEALAIGMATMLVSLLTGVQYFGLLSPGSLVANLVLIPLAGLVTLAGFLALLFGFVGFAAGAVFCNHAAALLLLVVEWLVRLSVRLPGVFLRAHYTTAWIGPVALMTLLAALLVGYAIEWKRGTRWAPFAIVALTLAFGLKFG